MYPSNNNNYSPISSSLCYSPNFMQYEPELLQYFHDHYLLQTQQEVDHQKVDQEEMNKCKKKKDRHSKIETARGPRDRRMRLSLDVARKFFSLQDLLGFDKASKTVEWLLTQSKSAVNELYKENTISVSSTSECEVISVDESATNDIQNEQKPSISKKKSNKSGRRGVFQSVIDKESRSRARDKARERTKLKKTQVEHSNVDDSNLGVTWSPYTIFNYHHNTEIPHQHQFTNLQFPGRSFWEA